MKFKTQPSYSCKQAKTVTLKMQQFIIERCRVNKACTARRQDMYSSLLKFSVSTGNRVDLMLQADTSSCRHHVPLSASPMTFSSGRLSPATCCCSVSAPSTTLISLLQPGQQDSMHRRCHYTGQPPASFPLALSPHYRTCANLPLPSNNSMLRLARVLVHSHCILTRVVADKQV